MDANSHKSCSSAKRKRFYSRTGFVDGSTSSLLGWLVLTWIADATAVGRGDGKARSERGTAALSHHQLMRLLRETKMEGHMQPFEHQDYWALGSVPKFWKKCKGVG